VEIPLAYQPDQPPPRRTADQGTAPVACAGRFRGSSSRRGTPTENPGYDRRQRLVARNGYRTPGSDVV